MYIVICNRLKIAEFDGCIHLFVANLGSVIFGGRPPYSLGSSTPAARDVTLNLDHKNSNHSRSFMKTEVYISRFFCFVKNAEIYVSIAEFLTLQLYTDEGR
jgi:hypothetical protein